MSAALCAPCSRPAYIGPMATSTATPAATTADGEEGLAQALDGQYDVLIVDRRLPKLDGLTVIGSLRSKGIETPALILSALGQIDDRVKGLRAGGDDYLPKPYSFSELLARTEVLARRRSGREETVYRVGDLELDRLTHQVMRLCRLMSAAVFKACGTVASCCSVREEPKRKRLHANMHSMACGRFPVARSLHCRNHELGALLGARRPARRDGLGLGVKAHSVGPVLV
jgi:CheY-like chemotaxis protein